MAKKTTPRKKVAKRKRKKPKKPQLNQLKIILRAKGLPGLYQVLRTKHGGRIPKELKDKLKDRIKRRTAALIVTEISNKLSDKKLRSVAKSKKATIEIAIKSRETLRLESLYRRKGMAALNAEMRKISEGKFPSALQVKIRKITVDIVMGAIMGK